MKIFKYTFLTLLCSTIILSCDKDDDDDSTTPPSTKADFALHFDHTFNNQTFSLNQNFTLGTGEIVKFSTAQFYVSNIRLMDDEQNMTTFEDPFVLVDPSVGHKHIGEMEASHYHMVMLNVGIDSVTNNTKQPIDFPDGHPLSAMVDHMWWSWNSGYIFFKLEGEVDRDGDGTFDDNFLYHIGTDANLIDKQKMMHSTVNAGDELEVHIKIDYSDFFNNVDMTNELEARMMPPALVSKMVSNAAAAIDFD